jgi:hypothetical protein
MKKYARDLLQKNADRKICADCTEKPRRLRLFFLKIDMKCEPQP